MSFQAAQAEVGSHHFTEAGLLLFCHGLRRRRPDSIEREIKMNRMHTSGPVRNWAGFDRHFRKDEIKLLVDLPRFDDAVLVAGCQRSGTTVVTRILREALAMPDSTFTRDDELDAALILSGAVPFDAASRCCFQTTYLNDHVDEYFEHDDYRLVWIIRNPEAVVRSMLFHWRRGALNRLFRACGRHALDTAGTKRFERFGTLGFRRAEKACLSYNVKTAQIHGIAARLGPERLYILDYDNLINRSEILLPDVFSFLSIPYDERLRSRLRRTKKPGGRQLRESLREQIQTLCGDEYWRAQRLAETWRSE